jgi:hypothetical protein
VIHYNARVQLGQVYVATSRTLKKSNNWLVFLALAVLPHEYPAREHLLFSSAVGLAVSVTRRVGRVDGKVDALAVHCEGVFVDLLETKISVEALRHDLEYCVMVCAVIKPSSLIAFCCTLALHHRVPLCSIRRPQSRILYALDLQREKAAL